MSEALQIFIGYDPREHEAYDVADHSIRRHASQPVLIHPLRLANLGHILQRPIERKDGKLWCPISEAPMATEFACSRFLAPILAQTGWALFLDPDVVVLENIYEILAYADPTKAVMCGKHEHAGTEGTKMDGQIQTSYA